MADGQENGAQQREVPPEENPGGEGGNPPGLGGAAGAIIRNTFSLRPDRPADLRPEAGADPAVQAAEDRAPAGKDKSADGEESSSRHHTPETIARALSVAQEEAKKCGDNQTISRAALILDIHPDTLRHRIENNDRLRALYGSQRSPSGPILPTVADSMKRSPTGAAEAISPETMDLVDMLTDAQRQLHYRGLEKAGLPVEQVKRLRNLEKLAGSTGEFIALALEKLSHNYYFQILKLMALADRTWDDLMLKPEDKGYVADAEARAFFNRNYTDMVKEAGRAYDLFLQGAQAMVEMMMKTQGIGGPKGGKKVKPGWTVNEIPKKAMAPMPD